MRRFQGVEISIEKLLLTGLIAVALLGIVSGQSIDTYSGDVIEAIITGTALSDRWVGFSGSVGSASSLSDSPFRSESAGDSRAGKVQDVTFEGQNEPTFFYVAIPFNGSDFNSNRLRNVSLNDVQAGGLFDESDYPVFYPDSSTYSDMSDSPVNTFESEGTVTLLNNTYETVKTDLQNGVPYHVVGYKYNSDVKPIYLSPVNDYQDCYDNQDCDFQFLVPKIDNSDQYYFYQVPEGIAINVTTFIDGQRSDTFEYSGRPYSLNITTRDIFRGGNLRNKSVNIVETGGNNLFAPSVNATSYRTSAIIDTKTKNGSKEILFSPTEYNPPDYYELEIRALNSFGKTVGTETLSVANNNIEFTTEGPSAKGLGEYETEYKKGVNRLTPIANCLFENINSGTYFELTPDDSTNSYTIVRGIPYVMDISSSNSDKFELSESGSHLVMSPVRTSDFGNTIHTSSSADTFDKSDQVVFTPTISKSEDDSFSLKMLDSQGSLNNQVNFSVKGSTCGSVADGSFTTIANSDEFKKRINSVTPILNSLFVAGT